MTKDKLVSGLPQSSTPPPMNLESVVKEVVKELTSTSQPYSNATYEISVNKLSYDQIGKRQMFFHLR